MNRDVGKVDAMRRNGSGWRRSRLTGSLLNGAGVVVVAGLLLAGAPALAAGAKAGDGPGAANKSGGNEPAERGKARTLSPEAQKYIQEQHFELPTTVVTFGTVNGTPRILLVDLTLAFPNSKDAGYIEFMRPKIMDALQTSLRRHGYDEYLTGNPAKIVKATALEAVQKALEPTQISDVLIINLLVQ